MKVFDVYYTSEAFDDLLSIHHYIADDLKEEINAKKQIEKIRDSINDLSTLPSRHKEVSFSPWKEKHIHQMLVDNYLVFYNINEMFSKVVILRIMYSKRNLEELINK